MKARLSSEDERGGCACLEQLLKQFRRASNHDSDAVDEVMRGMTDVSNGEKFSKEIKKYDVNIIWEASLKLIHHIISGKQCDEISDEPIPPHVLLSTVMDSYYYNKNDEWMDDIDTINHRTSNYSQQHQNESKSQKPSTPPAIIYLRSLLAACAIEKSVELTQKLLQSSPKAIRWRRLKSMVDDVIELFRKMVLDQLAKVLTFEHNATKEVTLLLTMATYVYVHNIFLACRDLMELLMQHSSDASFKTRVMKTSYTCIGMMTSLAALGFIFGQGDVASSSLLCKIIKCIEDPRSDNLCELLLHNTTPTGKQANRKNSCSLWDNIALNKCERGLDLMTDLLLYPSIRVTHKTYTSSIPDEIGHESSDDDSEYDSYDDHKQSTYDELGVAALASCCLMNATLPCPYGREYRWRLFIPIVHIFLNGLTSSSTLTFLSENQSLSLDDFSDAKAIESGFKMLDTLLATGPNTILCSRSPKSEGIDVAILTVTIEGLICAVYRLSAFKALAGDSSNDNELQQSTQQVMNMTQRLLVLYTPYIRIRALVSLAAKMKATKENLVLLPRVLDWMRPVIMQMCAGMQQHKTSHADNEEGITSIDIKKVILSITDALTPFMKDIEFAFDRATFPLPTDTSEFMSMAESYTSLISIFRLIRMWVHRASMATNTNAMANTKSEQFKQIKGWVDEYETVLRRFMKSLSNLLDFWCTSGSPRDVKISVVDNMEPPAGWQRLYLLLQVSDDSLSEFVE